MAIKTNENFYKSNFNELCCLGSGGFSTVFKSECKLDNKSYAIKKVCFKYEDEKTVTKELQFLAKLKSKFVVKYIKSWIEPNYYIGSYDASTESDISSGNLLYSPYNQLLLHIQMEICSYTLKDVTKIVNKSKSPNNTLSIIGYFISSELFYEIVECVQYLHSQNPAIIHRDLKPENILLTNFVKKRFVRIADFGLSTFHEFSEQSHTKYTGTKNYRAIEVNNTSKYTTKADMYSLGVILQELFQINISDSNCSYLQILDHKMNTLIDIAENLLSYNPSKRKNCDSLLNEIDLLRLKENKVLLDIKSLIKTIKKITKPTNENFIDFFIQNKIGNDIDCLEQEMFSLKENELKTQDIHTKTQDDEKLFKREQDILILSRNINKDPIMVCISENESDNSSYTDQNEDYVSSADKLISVDLNKKIKSNELINQLKTTQENSKHSEDIVNDQIKKGQKIEIKWNHINQKEYKETYYDLSENKLSEKFELLNLSLKNESEENHKLICTNWVNVHLNKITNQPIKDLYEDFRDGRNLLILLESLTGVKVNRQRYRMRVHCITNVEMALSFIKSEQLFSNRVHLESISAADIVDGNPIMTLGLIFNILNYYKNVDSSDRFSPFSTSKDLLDIFHLKSYYRKK